MNTGMIDINEGALSRWTRRSYAVLLLLVGAAILAGGVMLVAYRGSLYYLTAGLVLGSSGILIWRRDRRGVWFYGAVLAGTLAWAIWEVGFEPWGLVVRLAAPLVLGLPLLLRSIRPVGRQATALRGFPGWSVFAGGIVVALLLGVGFHAIGTTQPIDPLLQRGIADAPGQLAQPRVATTRGDWPAYGNDQGGTRFSPLTQITPQNVDQLQVAWEADTGPAEPSMSVSLEVTPINVGDSLYLCNAYNVVISLDAETGRERWRHNMTREIAPSAKPCRGVSYYRVPDCSGILCRTDSRGQSIG